MIVNEAGASVYSTSQVGREELPEFDATLRSGISIGRRLQDPLAELVKIEPQNIGVGLYQHDVNPKQLKETLESVISSCVNFVGVDLNTASVPLLRHVSGLNQLTARRIVDYRKDTGPVRRPRAVDGSRGDRAGDVHPGGGLPQAPRGRASARPHLDSPRELPGRHQAAGEVRLRARCRARQGPAARAARQLAEADLPNLAPELEVGEFTLRDIIEALGRPERDPRDDLPKPIFKKGVLKLEDLTAGMELKGTVLNVVDFGAFVDIGLKDSGLVHISQLANRYVKSPHDVVSVGDVVTVWVMGVDQERKRVSLTMVKPGTERHRGPAGRRGARRPGRRARTASRADRGPGQGRRGGGGGRGPRPPRLGADLAAGGCPLRSPPWPRPPSRRPDRDRPGSRPGQRPRPRAGRCRPGPARPGTAGATGRGPARRVPGPVGPRTRGGPYPAPGPGRRTGGQDRPQPTAARPAARARPSASAPLQGCPGRQRPAPNVRPAQAALAGSGRRPTPEESAPGGAQSPPSLAAEDSRPSRDSARTILPIRNRPPRNPARHSELNSVPSIATRSRVA